MVAEVTQVSLIKALRQAATMTGKVFLNYRRADAEAWADRLFERLVQLFPRENVFMDIDGDIPFGFPWLDWLDSQVAACDLMLVLIGRTWAAEFKVRSDAGERDYVRVEIESALKRQILVVPVFLGEAPVPQASELPDSIRPLLALQAAHLRRTSFDSDAETLAKGIARSIALARGEAPAERRGRAERHKEQRRRVRLATKKMSARVKDGKLVVEFEDGAKQEWTLPSRGDKEAIGRIREAAVAFALQNGATDPGQTNAVRKALTDADYHLTK
jgi:GAF domain-containing protein